MPDRHPRTSLVAALALCIGTLLIGAPAAAAATSTPMVPACRGINVRTGPSIGAAVKATLKANVTLTVAGKVSGGRWRTSCPSATSGSSWYRVTEIDGKSVTAAFGVTFLYAATGVLTAAPAPKPSGSDPYGADLIRLINLDRRALGLKPYMIDPRLSEIARDARFTCPTNRAKAFNGRARDMADRGYFGHIVPGCYSSGTTPFRSVEIVRRVFGYDGARSEILHWNSYPNRTTPTTYKLGCDIAGKNCKDGTTTAAYTVALAQRNFMSSAPHRAAELNSYQRIGCGSARVRGSSKTYFACLFADGGSTIDAGGRTPAPAPKATTRVPTCADVNLRTGPSISRAVKARLGTSARVSVVAVVSGSRWSASCNGAKSGATWYRISAVNGRSVKSLYGVTWLYAAKGLLKNPS